MKRRPPRLAALAVLAVAAPTVWSLPAAAAEPTVQRTMRSTNSVTALAAAPVATVEAERLSLPQDKGRVDRVATASAGAELLIWTNASATGTVQLPRAATGLQVVWRGEQCQGAPSATIDVDGRRLATVNVTSTTLTTHTVNGSWAPGAHRISIGFTNDRQAGCDRNLRVDKVTFTGAGNPTPTTTPTPTPTTTAGSNPLAGSRFWVDPNSNAGREAARNSGTTAAAYRKIADQPSTTWIGDWDRTQNVRARVAGVVDAARSTGTVPVFALYAIPGRDCGNYSAGGLSSASAYASWVREVAAGLGTSKAVVVLEPDALAQLDCLSETDRRTRTTMLSDAVGVLAQTGAVTYLDAGTSRWIPAATMAQRLRDAGVAQARGFALNVSNFGTTEQEAVYGDDLSRRLGGKTFVVDTSRNGNGPTDGWCNPQGRALGTPPTSASGRAGVDALLWIKRVGESDGDCGRGEPAAGTWWPSYALGLAQRAKW